MVLNPTIAPTYIYPLYNLLLSLFNQLSNQQRMHSLQPPITDCLIPIRSAETPSFWLDGCLAWTASIWHLVRLTSGIEALNRRSWLPAWPRRDVVSGESTKSGDRTVVYPSGRGANRANFGLIGDRASVGWRESWPASLLSVRRTWWARR